MTHWLDCHKNHLKFACCAYHSNFYVVVILGQTLRVTYCGSNFFSYEQFNLYSHTDSYSLSGKYSDTGTYSHTGSGFPDVLKMPVTLKKFPYLKTVKT